VKIRNSDNVIAAPPEQALGLRRRSRIVDGSEVSRLCEELSALIELLEEGVNSNALSRALWVISAPQSTECGDYIGKKLVALADGFEQWFRIDKWNRQDDGGPLVQHCLEDDLICIRAAIWCKSNDQKTLRRPMADCSRRPASRSIH
jgi:hypothetical protein